MSCNKHFCFSSFKTLLCGILSSSGKLTNMRYDLQDPALQCLLLRLKFCHFLHSNIFVSGWTVCVTVVPEDHDRAEESLLLGPQWPFCHCDIYCGSYVTVGFFKILCINQFMGKQSLLFNPSKSKTVLLILSDE